MLLFSAFCFSDGPAQRCHPLAYHFALLIFILLQFKKNMDFKKLAPEQKQAYLADIERALTSRRLYLKSNFSLADLAEETGIKLHNLSYLINSERGLSFSDYMHLWRIRHFKERLNDSEWKDLTLEKMTAACGFKSRATCWRAFVKLAGQTPSGCLKLARGIQSRSNANF